MGSKRKKASRLAVENETKDASPGTSNLPAHGVTVDTSMVPHHIFQLRQDFITSQEMRSNSNTSAAAAAGGGGGGITYGAFPVRPGTRVSVQEGNSFAQPARGQVSEPPLAADLTCVFDTTSSETSDSNGSRGKKHSRSS